MALKIKYFSSGKVPCVYLRCVCDQHITGVITHRSAKKKKKGFSYKHVVQIKCKEFVCDLSGKLCVYSATKVEKRLKIGALYAHTTTRERVATGKILKKSYW
jgi:hypothetical protein